MLDAIQLILFFGSWIFAIIASFNKDGTTVALMGVNMVGIALVGTL